jgi:DNA-binding transcriptional MerR regulator
MTTKELQNRLDVKAETRRFWQELRVILIKSETKSVMDGFKSRIARKADEYVERYDKCLPEDSIGIARCQEGRTLCREILLDFDEKTCNKTIALLDEEIKVLSEQIKTQSNTGKTISGFDALEENG